MSGRCRQLREEQVATMRITSKQIEVVIILVPLWSVMILCVGVTWLQPAWISEDVAWYLASIPALIGSAVAGARRNRRGLFISAFTLIALILLAMVVPMIHRATQT